MASFRGISRTLGFPKICPRDSQSRVQCELHLRRAGPSVAKTREEKGAAERLAQDQCPAASQITPEGQQEADSRLRLVVPRTLLPILLWVLTDWVIQGKLLGLSEPQSACM